MRRPQSPGAYITGDAHAHRLYNLVIPLHSGFSEHKDLYIGTVSEEMGNLYVARPGSERTESINSPVAL